MGPPHACAHDESLAVQAIIATGGVPVQFHLNNKTVDQTVYNVTHSLVGTSFVNGNNYYVTVEASNTAGSTNVTASQTTVRLFLHFALLDKRSTAPPTNKTASDVSTNLALLTAPLSLSNVWTECCCASITSSLAVCCTMLILHMALWVWLAVQSLLQPPASCSVV